MLDDHKKLCYIKKHVQRVVGDIEPGKKLDTLIFEKIFNVDISKVCDGELSDVDGHWECITCGASGQDWNNYSHTIQPLNFSTSIIAAWRLRDQVMRSKPWIAYQFTRLINSISLGVLEEEEAAYAICIVALRSYGGLIS